MKKEYYERTKYSGEVCKEAGCEEPITKRSKSGYCGKHKSLAFVGRRKESPKMFRRKCEICGEERYVRQNDKPDICARCKRNNDKEIVKKRLLLKRDIRWVSEQKLSTPCWLCKGNPIETGKYAYMKYAGKRRKVHRVAAMVFLGFDINSLADICHHCDIPICFNPRHLFIDDHSGKGKTNMKDAYDKGRKSNKGKRHPRAKLTPSQVREIRRRRAEGETPTALAKEFKVTAAHICRICKKGPGRAWNHIK